MGSDLTQYIVDSSKLFQNAMAYFTPASVQHCRGLRLPINPFICTANPHPELLFYTIA
jgi:hypothetical protein